MRSKKIQYNRKPPQATKDSTEKNANNKKKKKKRKEEEKIEQRKGQPLRERSLTVLYKVHTLQGHSLTPEVESLSTIRLSDVLRLSLRPFFCTLAMKDSRGESKQTALLQLRFVETPTSPVIIRPHETKNQASSSTNNNSSDQIQWVHLQMNSERKKELEMY